MTSPDFSPHLGIPASTLNEMKAITDDLIPPWDTYTPAWTTSGSAPSIGNGTLLGRYKQVGDNLLLVFARITWGTTTSAGTGVQALSLPSASGFSLTPLVCVIRDVSTSNIYATACRPDGAGGMFDFYTWTTAGVLDDISATHPMAWATGDQLSMIGVLPLA